MWNKLKNLIYFDANWKIYVFPLIGIVIFVVLYLILSSHIEIHIDLTPLEIEEIKREIAKEIL